MPDRLLSLDDYRPLVGDPVVERIRDKARPLRGLHVTHVNSTYYGGGVATLLSSLTLLMNDVGIRTGWRVIQGSPDFFSVTKKFHNALQGGNINLSPRKRQIYEDTVYENAVRNHLDHDVVVIHDPQPLPLVRHYRKRGPWIWRCHVDLTSPHPELWAYLIPFIERYDAVVVSMPEYRQELTTPQVVIPPAIDAFAVQNRELSPEEVGERLAHYGIPTDLPLVVQISRFDPWKDPQGVIEAFRLVREEVPATLVLLGNVATDDPEGEEVYRSLLDQREERIIILSRQDGALVNALQRRAAVVLQKSLREGFGLTVAEAMWKGTPVVGGNVGGIRHQIVDGVNGFLVSSVEEAAGRMVELLRDDDLQREMGTRARDTVRERFLMTALLERYLDLFAAFEPNFRLRDEGN
ncbi:MAG: Alpha,alpha-trehalose synthase [Candidatus Bipolaricaulis sibiricus]|uniref:Alpha,alpha-trehalose synthase n=1 Tax=Bipolaricaulis sibiricus TaxID=2501609 RepID=A0A410FSS7_BIPS1|nr:MAG: Alpha,alpha-trehalose synthase [Candidatus Bipolaricaulis sibiricus]